MWHAQRPACEHIGWFCDVITPVTGTVASRLFRLLHLINALTYSSLHRGTTIDQCGDWYTGRCTKRRSTYAVRLVQCGGDLAGECLTQSPVCCTKCNNPPPPIVSQCTNSVLSYGTNVSALWTDECFQMYFPVLKCNWPNFLIWALTFVNKLLPV